MNLSSTVTSGLLDADGALRTVQYGETGPRLCLRRHDTVTDDPAVTLVVVGEQIGGQVIATAVALAALGVDPHLHGPRIGAPAPSGARTRLDGQMRAASVSAAARRIEQASVRLSTLAMQRMEQTLPWFEAMAPEVRSSVGLLVQTGLQGFAAWLRHPDEANRITSDVFGAAPAEMARLVSLQQTVELVRVAVEVAEEAVGDLATEGEQDWLRAATVRFSRDIAWAAALVYARAAEQRGAWDARLESLVVDGILRGEINDALLSRAAALGWSQPRSVVVIAGYADESVDPEELIEDVHARAVTVGANVLAGVQTQRLVVLAGSSGRVERVIRSVLPVFSDGPVVVGPIVASLTEAAASSRAAFAGLRAARGWPDAPRPVASDALLPERALLGDAEACAELADTVYRSLADRGDELLGTVSAFLGCGASIEATARALFVHPNTVRYRLGKASEVCGCDLQNARGRYVAQVALTVGRLRDDERTFVETLQR
jgi:hypothetical protein